MVENKMNDLKDKTIQQIMEEGDKEIQRLMGEWEDWDEYNKHLGNLAGKLKEAFGNGNVLNGGDL